MATIIDKLRTLFCCAEEVNADLWQAGIDSAYMSVEELTEYVTKKCGVTISFKAVDAETARVFGFITRYKGGDAVIYIGKNIPDRFKPAVATKELCQILLDTEEDWRTDGIDTLERLVVPNIEVDAPENIAVRSEQLAERLSWELLYPIELRRRDLNEIAENKASMPEVAARVRLPLQIVALLLSAPYMEWCNRWWLAIAKRRAA